MPCARAHVNQGVAISTYHIYYIYIMAEDLDDYFSTDFFNWNYNEMINKPGLDPYNNKKKLDPFGFNEI
jgi:hypothetical protein